VLGRVVPVREDRHVEHANRDGAIAGLVAGGCGLAASEVVSGLLHQRVSPLVAMAEVIIHHTPGAVMEAAISAVGQHDKPLLVAGTLVGFLALSALGGAVGRRNIWVALGLFAAVGVAAMLASNARLTNSISNRLPAIVGTGIGMIVLKVLLDRVPRAKEAETDQANDADQQRRRFLIFVGTGVTLGVLGGALGRAFAHSRAAVEAARGRLRLPATKPVAPASTSIGIDGVVPWITPVGKFYRIDTSLSPPAILPKDYRLAIRGMVERELTLSYDDLVAMPFTEAWVTLCCVSNPVGGPLISNGRWGGVRIVDVLNQAGVKPGTDAVKSRSYDGWTSGTPLSVLTDGRNALLALTLNGEPLTPEHGFPVRMVVPGLYGYVSATKWVTSLEVTRFADFRAFWTDRGWSAKGPVKTQSRIDVPGDGDNRPAGVVQVAGIAWAQHRGIKKVEVRVNGGTWREARLAADPSIDTWVQWAYDWQATSGEHSIAVRAIDGDGVPQTGVETDVMPNGATGYHTIMVQIH
jgi:DMSO/TMAO reductase YedYZ molybdopterin-dependent catalytic subunit